MKRGPYKKKIDYAVYRGDEFLFIGTSDECVKRLGCSLSTFRWYASPVAKKRIDSRKGSKSQIVVVRLDDDEE